MSLFDDLENIRPVMTSEPMPEDTSEDTAPEEYYNILDTPVEMPDAPKTGRKGKIQKELEQLYWTMGTMLFPFDPQLAVVIQNSSEQCAASLYELSQKNPRIKRALEGMLNTGAYSAVIMAHLPILVMIATKYIPPVREQYSRIFNDFKDSQDA